MKYSLDEVRRILLAYSEVTEPELVIVVHNTVYEFTVEPDFKKCSLSAHAKRFDTTDVSFEEMFDPDHKVLGLCLPRDWDDIRILRCVPDLSEPSEVLARYLFEKKIFPDRAGWSATVLKDCHAYLQETYGEIWMHENQESPYYRVEDGSYLHLEYVSGFRGIVIEVAENEEEARHYLFYDSTIIFEGFDSTDAIRLLKDCIDDCWERFKREAGLR